jgi:tetratricopeptide (TPR) repeat protein
MFMQMGQFEPAKQMLLKALEAEPTSADILVPLGYILSLRRDFQGALPYYQRAHESEPKNSQVEFYLGSLYLDMGQFEKSVELLQSAVNRHESALKQRNTGATVSSEFSDADLGNATSQAYSKLAQALFYRGQPDDTNAAIRLLEGAIKTFGDAAATPLFTNLGALLLREGRLQEAANALERALYLSPEEPATCFNLANVYFEMGQFDKAAKQYETAIELQPSDAVAHLNLGLSLQRIASSEGKEVKEEEKQQQDQEDSKRRERAIIHIQRALSLGLDAAMQEDAYINLGAIHLSFNRLTEAAETFELMRSINRRGTSEQDNASRTSELFTDAAHLFRQQGENDLAKEWFEKALQLDEQNAGAHMFLGMLLYRNYPSELSSGVQHMQRAVSLDPQYASYLRTSSDEHDHHHHHHAGCNHDHDHDHEHHEGCNHDHEHEHEHEHEHDDHHHHADVFKEVHEQEITTNDTTDSTQQQEKKPKFTAYKYTPPSSDNNSS